MVSSTEKPAAVGRKTLSLKTADVEYRVRRNERTRFWDVLRNGIATEVSARKKRMSAVASAIRDAKAELETSKGSIVVTCLEGQRLETLWKCPPS
jgi:hypothetical protein